MTVEEIREVSANTRKQIEEHKAQIDEKHRELIATIKSLQNRSSLSEPQGLGDLLLATKEFQQRPPVLQRGMSHNIPIASKDILNVSRSMPERIPIVAAAARLDLRVRNLIPSSNTSAGAIQYMRELTFTNNAAPVAEGTAKPKSDKTFDFPTKPIETIAHYFKVSKQAYEDLAQLAAALDSNLVYGLDYKLEQQLLKGTGTTPEIGPGIYNVATATTLPAGTPAITDLLLTAAGELAAAGYMATGAVMSSADYTAMTLLKDSTGRYIGTVEMLPPIVVSPHLTAGQWLVGDFRQSHLFVREQTSITVAAYNEDDFVKNLFTVLGELRVALAVYNNGAFRRQPGAALAAEGGEAKKRP